MVLIFMSFPKLFCSVHCCWVFWETVLSVLHFLFLAFCVHTLICQNGDRGSLSITNLRLIWQSQRSSRTNLSKPCNNGTLIVPAQHLRFFCSLLTPRTQECVGIIYCRYRLLHYLEHQNSNRKKSTERKQVSALHLSSMLYDNRLLPASYFCRTGAFRSNSLSIYDQPKTEVPIKSFLELRFRQALYIMTKFNKNSFEFIFTSLVDEKPNSKMFLTVQSIFRSVKCNFHPRVRLVCSLTTQVMPFAGRTTPHGCIETSNCVAPSLETKISSCFRTSKCTARSESD